MPLASAEKPRQRRTPKNFYATALGEAERTALETAREIEGLDEEIAVLRVKLQRGLAEHPEDYDFLVKGIGLLLRAVSAKYRMGGKAEEDLYDSVVGVLKGVGQVLLPAEIPDER